MRRGGAYAILKLRDFNANKELAHCTNFKLVSLAMKMRSNLLGGDWRLELHRELGNALANVIYLRI